MPGTPGSSSFGSGAAKPGAFGGNAFSPTGTAAVAGSAFGSGAKAGGGYGAAPGGKVSPFESSEDEKIGEWIVDRELARGGMGVVYLGHRGGGDQAAIKVMLQTNGSVNQRKVKRFLREIDSTSKLIHPGIVKILDSGEFRGYPYFAMEFVEGKPLDKMLKEDLDLEIGMEILEKMSRAVHYAHEQGVIHRDLKPANVMVREDMEPKLTDFGLAKDKDHQSVLTKTGAVLGTPYYLSPEQASGKSKSIDRRADIYSLGVIMYELATGRLPFVGQTTVELYNRIIHDEPVPPTKIKPQLTKALETVCLKAMAKEVDDRYPTSEELADDLQALLQGGTIKARPDGPLKKWWKKTRKRGSIPLVLGGTAILLAAVLGILIWQYKSMEEETKTSSLTQQIEDLEEAPERAFQEKVTPHLAQGNTALLEGQLPKAIESADAALKHLDDLDAKYEAVSEDNAEAAAELREATAPQRKRMRASALVLRARARMYLNEPSALDDAQKDLDLVLGKEGIRPTDLDAQVAQGNLLVLKGQVDEALERFDKALKVLPTSVRALHGKALALMIKEEFKDAVAALTRAVEALDQPAEAPAEPGEDGELPPTETIPDGAKPALKSQLLVLQTIAYLELAGASDLKKARETAQKAIDADKDGWRGHACLGAVLSRLGHLYEALEAFDKAIELGRRGGVAGPHIAKAEGLMVLGWPKRAVAPAQEAVKLDPGSLVAVVVLAEAEEELLQTEDAESHADDVLLRAHKRDWRVKARAARLLARIEASKGNIEEAHGHAKSATKINEGDPFSSEGQQLLALLQLNPAFEGQFLENAEKLLKRVHRLRGNSLGAKRGLGLVVWQKYASDPGRAKKRFENALVIDPHDPWSHSYLAQALWELAKKTDDKESAEAMRAAAVKKWDYASRYERDVRRPEGRAFAAGLRLEKLARGAEDGKERSMILTRARTAYQRATHLVPSHTQAHTGLASLALKQRVPDRAGKHLAQAYAANRQSAHTAAMSAYHLAAMVKSVDRSQATKAIEALARARKLFGNPEQLPIDLAICQIIVESMQRPRQVDLKEKIPEIQAKFAALRKRDVYNVQILKSERALVNRLADRVRQRKNSDVTGARARAREIGKEIGRLQTDRDRRMEKSKALLAKARASLKAEDGIKAAEFALGAARQTPWDANAWRALAEARDHEMVEDLWGALAAGIRASWLDDSYLKSLFTLLRRAGKEPAEESRKAVAERLQKDREIHPMPRDLELLMEAAPIVSRALVMKVKREEAKKAFAELEKILNHDPTKLVSHVMLGALALGVRRDPYAVERLLFVHTVYPELGEAAYLAAVAAARASRTRIRKMDVIALESLRAAGEAKFDWKAQIDSEPALAKLKASPLWQKAKLD